ncbi:YDG domain-containing protein, partial [Flavobacterium maritimum]|uniref:YDG domain-containing protein n=1 Tax=Flavobacterium maritimum TaxID=3149042 RepID=UPI0032B418E5
MKTFLPKSAFLTIVFFIANLVFASTAFGQATVTTDQPDYAPGSTCTITGSGFLPGETVTLQVMHADETPNDGEEHFLWDVIADENGNFVTTWHVCEDDCLGSTLKATADGETSGLHAEVIFTDGNVRVKSSTSTASIFWSDLPSTDCTGVPISSGTGTATTNSGLTFSKLNTNTLKSLRIEAPLQAANGYYFSSWSGPAGAYTVDGSNPRVICVPGTNSNGIQDFTISYVACSPPTITGQPNAAVISYGSNSSFTVVAAGTTPLTYQWQENAGSGFVNISNGGVYSNTTEATLTLTKPTVEMSGRTYRCIVTGACLPTTISNGVATLTVNPVELIPHITANDKPYDGGTSATLSAQWVTGMVNNETDVTLIVGVKSFDNANTGARTVTASSLTLGGTKAGNYVLAVSATAADDAAITAVELIPHITANDKPYDGGTNATLSAQWLTGMVNNETDVTLIVGAKSFDNANTGARTVTASSLTLGGTEAGNYVLAVSATATDDAA